MDTDVTGLSWITADVLSVVLQTMPIRMGIGGQWTGANLICLGQIQEYKMCILGCGLALPQHLVADITADEQRTVQCGLVYGEGCIIHYPQQLKPLLLIQSLSSFNQF